MNIQTDMLLQLADFLKQPTPSTHFDFGTWVGIDWAGKPDLSCGTSACALGWSTVLFPHLLSLVKTAQGVGRVEYVGQQPDTTMHASIAAAMHAFGLQRWEAEYLFLPGEKPPEEYEYQLYRSPSENATAHQVAQHIRHFVQWAQKAA
jgi:hypothetical protein